MMPAKKKHLRHGHWPDSNGGTGELGGLPASRKKKTRPAETVSNSSGLKEKSSLMKSQIAKSADRTRKGQSVE